MLSYFRLLRWLSTYNYDSLKENQMEMSGKEQLIISELASHGRDIEKQKKRIKLLVQMLEDQYETTRLIAEELQIKDD